MARVGDIFSIPLSDGQTAFGIIYICRAVLYIGVFDIGTELEDICIDPNSNLFLCGWTTDALIFHARWKIERRTSVNLVFPRPCYKLGSKGNWRKESFDQSTVVNISDKVASKIDYRTNFAPITFQRVLEEFARNRRIELADQRLTVEYLNRQIDICGNF